MEILEQIALINFYGYSVSFRQYNKLKVNNEALWEGVATHINRDNVPGTYIYMDEITFGRSFDHVLGKLLDKVKTSSEQRMAEAKKKPKKVVDPFDGDDEDAFE